MRVSIRFRSASILVSCRVVGAASCLLHTEQVQRTNHLAYNHTDTIEGTPIFYLHRFTLEEERIVRDALSELNDYEDEDFGGNWIFFGYIFPSNSSRSTSDKHTITDLRDLFEGCHRFSPTFDPKSPYRFANYPRNFIVVDEKCLDEDHPKVLLASSLDFHDPNLDDKLGWYYGYVEAKDAHLNWVNLDIANMVCFILSWCA